MLYRNGTVFHHQGPPLDPVSRPRCEGGWVGGFWTRAACELDLSEYPTDLQRCCLTFQSSSYPDKLRVRGTPSSMDGAGRGDLLLR